MLTVPSSLFAVLSKCPRLCLRHASNWEKKNVKKEDVKKTVFQYAGKNIHRTDRVYAWGCSATGALG